MIREDFEFESYAKPLSFSTTMRNPNRITGFLNCLLPFEGMILTDDLIMKIVHSIIKNKLYRPVYVGKITSIKNAFDEEDGKLTDREVREIIKCSPQKHKEKGFSAGWPSRFDTWFKLPKEFGFVFYEMGLAVMISSVGHMLIDAFNEVPVNELKIQNVFLNSMMKYQTDNPFRKNINSNKPLGLLLNVIKLLEEDKEIKSPGIFKKELSLFICWPDNNSHSLYEMIKGIRKSQRFNYSDEYMYDLCLTLLVASDKRKRFKINQICGEAVDEYIRKMRITGVVSLRGNGRFLDVNSFEKEKVDYVLNNYSKVEEFSSKEKYFAYIGKIDSNIMEIKEMKFELQTDLRKKKLKEYSEVYSSSIICD
ncbi:MAG: AlwI family type II restriction endonuclease, partial [Bacilli bacterium]